MFLGVVAAVVVLGLKGWSLISLKREGVKGQGEGGGWEERLKMRLKMVLKKGRGTILEIN